MRRLLYWFTQNSRILDIDAFDDIGITTRFPLWVVLFLSVLAVLVTIFMYRKIKGLDSKKMKTLVALRAAAYIMMLLIIAGPKLHIQGKGRPEGPLPIIVDRTESMSITDVSGGPRLAAALKIEKSLEANAETGLGLQQVHYLYGDEMVPWDLATDPVEKDPVAPDILSVNLPARFQGTQTSVRKMIIDGLKQHGGAYIPGIVIIGDGAHNASELFEPAIDYVKQHHIPVYFVPTGQEKPRDIALNHVIGEEIVFVEEKFKFFVSMQQFGYTGRNLAVKGTFGADAVEIPNIRPEQDGAMTFPVEFTPQQTGLFDLTVKIPPVGEEVTVENNTVTHRVRVIKDRIRILLVFGGPSWEFRFLNGAFDRDRRVQHKSYLQSVDPRIFKYNQSKFIENLPTVPAELYRNYDMVMVSGIDMHTLPPDFLKILRTFIIGEGGSLVVISDGSEVPYSLKGTVLEQLLPVRIPQPVGSANFSQETFKSMATPYKLKIAEEGNGNPLVSFDVDLKRNENIWDSFPEMFEVCPEAEVKPSGIVVVEQRPVGSEEAVPAIVYHTIGKGMVLYMGFDATWRWRKEVGDRYFRDYWGKVAQFMGFPHLLGESAPSRLYVDRLEANIGDRIVVSAVVRNKDYSPLMADRITVSLKHDAENPTEMDMPVVSGRPGIYRASFYPDTEGKYVIALPPVFTADSCEIRVSRVSREFQQSGVDVPLMRQVSGDTGGHVFTETLSGAAVSAESAQTEQEPGSAAKIDKAAADRESELKQIRQEIEKKEANPLDDSGFLDKLSRHVLLTIAEQRPTTTILEENSLWDTVGFMLMSLILLCVEYFFRKRWYVD